MTMPFNSQAPVLLDDRDMLYYRRMYQILTADDLSLCIEFLCGNFHWSLQWSKIFWVVCLQS